VFAVISAYYYLQIIKSMYFEDTDNDKAIVTAPMDMQLVLSINAVLILVIGLFPDFWMKLALSLF
jgi:NADH-quinone oxidoreductase subunit N